VRHVLILYQTSLKSLEEKESIAKLVQRKENWKLYIVQGRKGIIAFKQVPKEFLSNNITRSIIR